jgi:hypothetical protein
MLCVWLLLVVVSLAFFANTKIVLRSKLGNILEKRPEIVILVDGDGNYLVFPDGSQEAFPASYSKEDWENRARSLMSIRSGDGSTRFPSLQIGDQKYLAFSESEHSVLRIRSDNLSSIRRAKIVATRIQNGVRIVTVAMD